METPLRPAPLLLPVFELTTPSKFVDIDVPCVDVDAIVVDPDEIASSESETPKGDFGLFQGHGILKTPVGPGRANGCLLSRPSDPERQGEFHRGRGTLKRSISDRNDDLVPGTHKGKSENG
ncbi:hypothetical protein TWF788_002119 [Orbilia oligospora]|uniref:Uncharacterized protein n=1 Tax=Orbilia oligospora TaxID=2813651 RepID=A0A6G1M2P5_ORBOL|nr:hypothetical protein TWF788_002119 [Orbilia oligospora]KAF3201024.1 hypothetical protein TWF679_000511 [Orbilia oligospora]KAF3243444.1 hypothetical protein TWF192_008351 [Orbilia oligospora]